MTHETRHRSTSDVQDWDEDGYDDQWPPRTPSSSRRYVQSTTTSQQHGTTRYTLHPNQVQRMPIPARQSAQRLTQEPPAMPLRQRRRSGGSVFRSHALGWVVFGMLVIVLGWTGLQALGAWWNLHQDDATYGRPRTAQYDVVVGHNDSASSPTHIIALNLHATIEVIELPGGDATKAKIYQGPHLFGSGADLFPVTLTFPDPTGSGKPNMEIHVQGVLFVYLNQNGQFVPQPLSH